MYNYYRLMDSKRKGTIVKKSTEAEFMFSFEKREWIPCGVMLDYFFYFYDESPYTQDAHEQISEDEVRRLGISL